jgi:hypothetical protein
VLHDLYPSKEARAGALASGSVPEQLEQLDALIVILPPAPPG